MSGPWSIIRALAAGALYFPGCCSASGSNDAILYNELTDCIDLQFEHTPAPASFREIDLAADCPELQLSLAESNWADRTALANHDHPNLAQLADLRYILHGTVSPRESRRSLDFSRLGSILAETLDTDTRGGGQNLWERLLNWLRQRHKGREDVDLSWLQEWLEKLTLSKAASAYVAYGVSAMLILLAAGFIITEIRLARRGRSAPGPRRTTHRNPAGAAPLDDDTPPQARQLPCKLPELLNVCIDYLIRNQRLPETRSRTNREFLRHLLHTGDRAASDFEHLLRQAECVLYGDRDIDTQTLQQCRRVAADLLGTQASVTLRSPLQAGTVRQ